MLKEIIENKRKEVEISKKNFPLDSFKHKLKNSKRDLGTLEIDTNTTLRLVNDIPKGKIIISESGISSRDYVEKIQGKVNAMLVGSAFMNSGNIEESMIKLMD